MASPLSYRLWDRIRTQFQCSKWVPKIFPKVSAHLAHLAFQSLIVRKRNTYVNFIFCLFANTALDSANLCVAIININSKRENSITVNNNGRDSAYTADKFIESLSHESVQCYVHRHRPLSANSLWLSFMNIL